MAHSAEIIAVGTELLLGNITNTNATMLSQQLSALGVGVYFHTVVGDNPGRLRDALLIARTRADIIITTGGLGPTYDDLTKQVICETFGQKLVLHEDILKDIRLFYEGALHVPMPENNAQQAYLPEHCTIFDNPVGTAPGCAFEAGGVHVLMLPGPPHECRTMLERCVVPYLRALSKDVILSHDIMTFGMGESSVDMLLHEKMAHMVNPSLATYAKPSEVRLRATASAASAAEAEALLKPVVDEVTALLGDIVYGIDVPNLETVCLRLLCEKHARLAAAEYATGGAVAQRLASLEGSEAVFAGGWVAMEGGVPFPGLSGLSAPACSAAAVIAQAKAAREAAGADYGLAVSPAAREGDGSGEESGVVYIALATPSGTRCRRLDPGRRRHDRIRAMAANHAFDLVRRVLLGLSVPDETHT